MFIFDEKVMEVIRVQILNRKNIENRDKKYLRSFEENETSSCRTCLKRTSKVEIALMTVDSMHRNMCIKLLFSELFFQIPKQ